MLNIIQKHAADKKRKEFGRLDKKRDAGQTTPENIKRYDNIVYGNDKKWPKWQLLDVYRPKEVSVTQKLPVIVSVHGGGWVYGDKDVYQFYCMRLAQRGFAVVNYSYRLAPENTFPASLIDTENVFQWITDNAVEYGLDTENVFAVGDSAGAHLLSLYASALTNEEYAKNFPFIHKKQLFLRAIALNCGKYKIAFPEDNDELKTIIRAFLPQHGSTEELNLIDGSAHITEAFPPTFVMSCKGDFLLSQVPYITKALEEARIEYVYHCYGSDEKPLWHVFHCDPKLSEAVTCNDNECDFFKQHSSSKILNEISSSNREDS